MLLTSLTTLKMSDDTIGYRSNSSRMDCLAIKLSYIASISLSEDEQFYQAQVIYEYDLFYNAQRITFA